MRLLFRRDLSSKTERNLSHGNYMNGSAKFVRGRKSVKAHAKRWECLQSWRIYGDADAVEGAREFLAREVDARLRVQPLGILVVYLS